MQCKHCGKNVVKDDTYCPECGKKVSHIAPPIEKQGKKSSDKNIASIIDCKHCISKKLSYLLPILMFIVIIVIAGISIFFQNSSRQLNTQYQETNKNYTTAYQSLQRCQIVLAEKFNSTILEVSKYDQLYSKKISELDKLYSQKISELDVTKTNLLQKDADLKETQAMNAKLEQAYQQVLIDQQALKQLLIEAQGQLRSCQSRK